MDEYLKKWIQKADNDLQVAFNELNITGSDIITDIICFHCQQAVEKYLKVFLISKKIEFKKTHNLDFLLSLCIDKDPDFNNISVGDLSSYAVEIRYPDDFYMPTVAETKQAFCIAQSVKEFVIKKITKS